MKNKEFINICYKFLNRFIVVDKLIEQLDNMDKKNLQKKGDKAYIRKIINNNIALANPDTKEYFKSAWTNELDKLEKDIDYKKIYEEEKEINNKLQNKINEAIKILNE